MSTTSSVVDLHQRRRWFGLAAISLASLMVVLDASVVNIALPQAQNELGLTTANRQWVITAYTLTFGGLLLLGGRVADFVGLKRAFVVALVGFTIASAIGGFAPNPLTLFAARALQGVFAAVLAPAALSLIASTFSDPKERGKAFGVYGAVQGAGGAIGLIAGGLLTELVSWRWCLFINIPIALIALAISIPTLKNSRAQGPRAYDVPGAVLVTLGATALVLGFTNAAESGWTEARTILTLVLAVLLLIAFVIVERKVSAPLLPLRLVLDRNRGGAFALSTLIGAGMFGMLLFLAYYLQTNLNMTPVQTGLSFLPFSGCIILTAMIAPSLIPRYGEKTLLVLGATIAALGMALLSLIQNQSTFLTGILPGEIIVGLGLGLIFVPLNSIALSRIEPHDMGVASAVVNTTQQLGGAIGVALLNTIFASAIANAALSDTGDAVDSQTINGYKMVFLIAAALFALGAVIAGVMMRRTRFAAVGTT